MKMYVFGHTSFAFNLITILQKKLRTDFGAIYSVCTKYMYYFVFQILQKYESRNILPFAGPYCKQPLPLVHCC